MRRTAFPATAAPAPDAPVQRGCRPRLPADARCRPSHRLRPGRQGRRCASWAFDLDSQPLGPRNPACTVLAEHTNVHPVDGVPGAVSVQAGRTFPVLSRDRGYVTAGGRPGCPPHPRRAFAIVRSDLTAKGVTGPPFPIDHPGRRRGHRSPPGPASPLQRQKSAHARRQPWKTRMSSDYKTILQQANAAVAAGDNEGFLAFCTDDVTWHFIGERTITGKDA